MRLHIRILLCIATALAVAGCKSKSTGTPALKPQAGVTMVEGVSWKLAEVNGRPVEPVAADDRAAHFKLDAAQKRAAGYSSINNFQGGYELDGSKLKFGNLAMTRRAGPEPLMNQESAFTKAMGQTASWRAAGADGIELLDINGNVLARFTRGD